MNALLGNFTRDPCLTVQGNYPLCSDASYNQSKAKVSVPRGLMNASPFLLADPSLI